MIYFHYVTYTATPLRKNSWNLQFWHTLSWSSVLYTDTVSSISRRHQRRFKKKRLIWLCPRKINPFPTGQEILVYFSLVIITIYSVCHIHAQEQIIEETMQFHHMTYMTISQHNKALSWMGGGGGNDILVDQYPLVIITTGTCIYSVCLIYAQKQRGRSLKKYSTSFYIFYFKIISPWC